MSSDDTELGPPQCDVYDCEKYAPVKYTDGAGKRCLDCFDADRELGEIPTADCSVDAGTDRDDDLAPDGGQPAGTERIECVECGKDLTDPKNCGDPDVGGDWVCVDGICRSMHEAVMTVNRRVIRS